MENLQRMNSCTAVSLSYQRFIIMLSVGGNEKICFLYVFTLVYPQSEIFYIQCKRKKGCSLPHNTVQTLDGLWMEGFLSNVLTSAAVCQ